MQPALGRRIRELREEKNLSLRELARTAKIAAPYLCDIELGRRTPSRNKLHALAIALAVDPAELEVFDCRPVLQQLIRRSAADPEYGNALAELLRHIASADDLVELSSSIKVSSTMTQSRTSANSRTGTGRVSSVSERSEQEPAMNVSFTKQIEWDGTRGGVLFWSRRDGDDVRCFVSRDYLHDEYGGSGSKDSVLEQFANHRREIESLIIELLRRNQLHAIKGIDAKEAQLLTRSDVHRAYIVCRVDSDQLLGSQIAKYAPDPDWWGQYVDGADRAVTTAYREGVFDFVEICLTSEEAARKFEHILSSFGVEATRLVNAG